MTIVKVQKPVFSTDPGAQFLIYDRPQTHMAEQPIPIESQRAMRSSFKMFFHAEFNVKKQQWDLGEVAEWQTW